MNVLIISSSDGITLSVLRCLGLMNATSHVINIWHSSNSSRLSRFCHRYFDYSRQSCSIDIPTVFELINDYCDCYNIEAVIPSGLLATFLIAKIKPEIVVPVFPVSVYYRVVKLVLLLVRNKEISSTFKREVTTIELSHPTASVFVQRLLRGQCSIWSNRKLATDLA